MATVLDSLIIDLRFKSDTRELLAAERRFLTFRRNLDSASRSLMTAGMALTAPLLAIVKTSFGFEKAQNLLIAILETTKDKVRDLRQQAEELGRTTQFSAAQATQAQAELAKVGFKQGEILQLTPHVLSLAAAGQIGMANAAAIASKQIRSFGLDAGEFERVVDVFVRAQSTSLSTVSELGRSFRQTALLARQLNIPIEEATAYIVTLRDAGRDASQAGTDVRNILSRLLVIRSGKAAEAIKELGLPIEYVQKLAKEGNIHRIFQLFKRGGFDPSHASKIFGRQAVAGSLALAANIDTLLDRVNTLASSEGAGAEFIERLNRGIIGALRELWSAIQGFAIVLGESGLNRFIEVTADAFRKFINVIAQAPAFILNMGTAFLFLGPILVAVGGMLRVISTALGGYKIALDGIIFVLGRYATKHGVSGPRMARWKEAFRNAPFGLGETFARAAKDRASASKRKGPSTSEEDYITRLRKERTQSKRKIEKIAREHKAAAQTLKDLTPRIVTQKVVDQAMRPGDILERVNENRGQAGRGVGPAPDMTKTGPRKTQSMDTRFERLISTPVGGGTKKQQADIKKRIQTIETRGMLEKNAYRELGKSIEAEEARIATSNTKRRAILDREANVVKSEIDAIDAAQADRKKRITRAENRLKSFKKDEPIKDFMNMTASRSGMTLVDIRKAKQHKRAYVQTLEKDRNNLKIAKEAWLRKEEHIVKSSNWFNRRIDLNVKREAQIRKFAEKWRLIAEDKQKIANSLKAGNVRRSIIKDAQDEASEALHKYSNALITADALRSNRAKWRGRKTKRMNVLRRKYGRKFEEINAHKYATINMRMKDTFKTLAELDDDEKLIRQELTRVKSNLGSMNTREADTLEQITRISERHASVARERAKLESKLKNLEQQRDAVEKGMPAAKSKASKAVKDAATTAAVAAPTPRKFPRGLGWTRRIPGIGRLVGFIAKGGMLVKITAVASILAVVVGLLNTLTGTWSNFTSMMSSAFDALGATFRLLGLNIAVLFHRLHDAGVFSPLLWALEKARNIAVGMYDALRNFFRFAT